MLGVFHQFLPDVLPYPGFIINNDRMYETDKMIKMCILERR